MNKLVIIGNGFDLAHGLETRYSDFLLWEINEAFKQTNIVKPSSFHIESPLFAIESNYRICQHPSLDPCEFEDIAGFLQYLKDNKDGRLIIKIKYSYSFVEHLIQFANRNWVDIEREYFRELVKISTFNGNEESKNKMLSNLNQSVDLIRVELKNYLSVKNIISFDVNNEIKRNFFEINNRNKLDQTNSTLILNFNYTDTAEKYLPNPNIQINYIHGKLKDSKNPLIFGYGDEMDENYEKIEKLYNNDYLKHMKSFAYLQTANYRNLFEFLDKKNQKFDVFIMGHSCGLSDRLLFTHIFEHSNFNSVQIYYYAKPDGTNDFFEKTQEISRYFRLDSKHKMRKCLVPFNESKPLTQFKPQN